MLHTVWETETLLLPNRLHRARRESGLTQEEVAERTGVARNTVSRYELGRQAPSGRALLRLAAIYGKPMEWFYGEEDEPQGDSGRVNAPESAAQSEPGTPDSIVSLDEVSRDLGARFDRLESYVRSAVAETRVEYDAGDESPMRDPVDVNEVASAAGGGAEVFDETVVGRLWFRRDWLQRNAIDPKQCNVISVRGESMEPTLPDGVLDPGGPQSGPETASRWSHPRHAYRGRPGGQARGQGRRGELVDRERASSVAAGALVGHYRDRGRSAMVRKDVLVILEVPRKMAVGTLPTARKSP